MQFIELDGHFINLDFVTDVQLLDNGSLTVVFAVREFEHARTLRIQADQAGPLLAWLRGNATRLSAEGVGRAAQGSPVRQDERARPADDADLAWTEQ